MKWTNNSSACRDCPMNSFPTPTPCSPRPYYYATNIRIGPADKHYFREYCVIYTSSNVIVVTHEYSEIIHVIPRFKIIICQWICKELLTCTLSRYTKQQMTSIVLKCFDFGLTQILEQTSPKDILHVLIWSQGLVKATQQENCEENWRQARGPTPTCRPWNKQHVVTRITTQNKYT